MKKLFAFLIISFFVLTAELFAQNVVRQTTRRDCSFVSRPIIDIGGGVVNGKAIKIISPRLNASAQRFAQNAIVVVVIETDEKGKVIYAKATSGIPILQNLSQQAAKQTRFSPTLVDYKLTKRKGQIVYRFNQGKTYISYNLESVEYEPVTIKGPILSKFFDRKILSVIYDFREGKKLDSYPFVENGQAKIQICIYQKTPEIIERIKETGFELREETRGNGLVGQIAIENLVKLAEIEEIRFIVPEP